MSIAKLAIDGFGRIGRAVCRIIAERPSAGIEIVAVDDRAADDSRGAREDQRRSGGMTYSIIARDPAADAFGVAAQSHWFNVAQPVARVRFRIGAVATQASAGL